MEIWDLERVCIISYTPGELAKNWQITKTIWRTFKIGRTNSTMHAEVRFTIEQHLLLLVSFGIYVVILPFTLLTLAISLWIQHSIPFHLFARSLSVSSSLLCGLLYSRELTLEHCANGYSVTVVQLGLRTNLASADRCWGAFGYSEAYYFLYRRGGTAHTHTQTPGERFEAPFEVQKSV